MSDKIEDAKQVLADAGYCLESFWVTADVTLNFETSEDEAVEILSEVFNNDCLISEINNRIAGICISKGFKEIVDE